MNTARCRADAYFARHDERFPIPDVSVPRSAAHLGGVLLTIDRRIREGVLFLYTVGEELVARSRSRMLVARARPDAGRRLGRIASEMEHG